MSDHKGASQVTEFPPWAPWQTMSKMVTDYFGNFAAPRNLQQPILPGWVLGGVVNITDQNSHDPDTEREVVAQHSYGKQLGRVTEALAAIIARLPEDEQKKDVFVALTDLNKKIKAIKDSVSGHRLGRIKSDLKYLEKRNKKEYDQLLAELAAGKIT